MQLAQINTYSTDVEYFFERFQAAQGLALAGLVQSSWGMLNSRQHVCLRCCGTCLHSRRQKSSRLNRKHSVQVCCN